MNTVVRSVTRSALAGAAVGFVILGIAAASSCALLCALGRQGTRVHPSGTFTVVMMGLLAGLAAGVVHGLLRRFVTWTVIRIALFVVFCVAFTWHGANALLPRPRLSFVALTLAYVAVLELISSKAQA